MTILNRPEDLCERGAQENPFGCLRGAAAALISALLLLASAPGALAQTEDDLFLFTSSIAPNVLIQLDNSGSMKHIVWHPAFDPDGSYDCSYYNPSSTYYTNSSYVQQRCGREIMLYTTPHRLGPGIPGNT